jgi:flagellar motor switch/type III secretory pathway protein FliN
LEGDLARGGIPLIAASATVLLADTAYAARLVLPHHLLESAADGPSPTTEAGALASTLGPVPLAIPIVACATLANATEVASLRVGDAWLPSEWPLQELGDADKRSKGLVGPVTLASPSAEVGVSAELVEGGRLVLRGHLRSLSPLENALEARGMEKSDERNALIEAVGDVPVVVRVEIGEACMAARDWAALGRGDVITLGRRVGEPVILRVGGVPLARGDLVEVDGVVGVRIAERLAPTGMSP